MLPYGHILCHVVRLLEIAKELRLIGYEIIFAGEGKYMQLPKGEGFEVLSTKEADHERLMAAVRKNKIRFIQLNELEILTRADIDLYERVKPDLILSDGRISAPVSAKLCGILHGAVVNASSTRYRAIPYVPLLPLFSNSSLPSRTNSGTLIQTLQKLNVTLECKLFNLFMPEFTKLSKKYNLNMTTKASDFLTGIDFSLLPDIPEYLPTIDLPDNFYYIGPITWKNALEPPSWINEIRKNIPVVYVTMGSTGMESIYKRLDRLFTDLKCQIVIATGGQIDKAKIPPIPHKIFVEEYVNGDIIMEISDAVICHGGNGTIYQAIKNGVPILGIPTHHDQAYNMKRVEALKIGIKIAYPKFRKSSAILEKSLRKILADFSYRQTVFKYQEIARQYNPAKKAAEIIGRYVS